MDSVEEDSEGIGNSKDTVVEDLAEEDSVEENSEENSEGTGNSKSTEEDSEDLAEDSAAAANSAQESAADDNHQHHFHFLRDSSPAAVHSPQSLRPHFPPASS